MTCLLLSSGDVNFLVGQEGEQRGARLDPLHPYPWVGGAGGGAVTPFPHRAQTAVGYSRCFSDPLLEKTAINKHKQGAGPSLSPLQGGVSPLLGGSLKTSRTLARHRGVCVCVGGGSVSAEAGPGCRREGGSGRCPPPPPPAVAAGPGRAGPSSAATSPSRRRC